MLRPVISHPRAMVRPPVPQPWATAHQPQLSNRLGQPKPNFVFSGGLRPPLAYHNELNHLESAPDCCAKLPKPLEQYHFE